MSRPSHKIIDALGDATLLGLGISERNIEHFRWSGLIAAKWYGAISEECETRGIECPKNAFTFVPRKCGGRRRTVQRSETIKAVDNS